MPYVVILAGIGGIVILWVTYVRDREKFVSAKNWATVTDTKFYGSAPSVASRVLGTLAALAAIWFWGVQGVVEERERAAYEQEWLDTFVDSHRQDFYEGCEEILLTIDASGVAYDRDTGRAVTIPSCKDSWFPPEIPSTYSSSQYDQPERQPPWESEAIFGPNVGAIMCADPNDDETCYSWDNFITVPPPDEGW